MTIVKRIDIANKHVSHHDYFSKVLENLTLMDAATQEEFPVVVTDAYFNTVSSFKGKLFLMGSFELVLGSISSWADILLDTMEAGDYSKAIELATGYYLGVDDWAILGLPTNDEERKAAVINNLPEMIVDSIRSTVKSKHEFQTEALSDLLNTCLDTWMTIGKPDQLLEDMFECCHTNGFDLAFFQELCKRIFSSAVSSIPPSIFRELVKQYGAIPEYQEKLEELICTLDVKSMDLDLTISLCKEHKLQDTLIYIWNQALGDFITPLVELIEDLKTNPQGSESRIYAYISYILTGRVYPTGCSFERDQDAQKARFYVYYFIFSISNIAWPQQGGSIITIQKNKQELQYPYLLFLIQTNCSAFFTALNEAFEDPFLNDPLSIVLDETDQPLGFEVPINRQYIVDILINLFFRSHQPSSEASLNELLAGKRIFLDIFLARNYPKYSQFISIDKSILSQVLEDVSECTDENLKRECELGLEALLSKYKPSDFEHVVEQLQKAQFHRVLETIYRSNHDYPKLLALALSDARMSASNECNCLDILSAGFKHDKSSMETFVDTISGSDFAVLANQDCARLGRILSKYAPQLHDKILSCDKKLQFEYMKHLKVLPESLDTIYRYLLADNL